LAGNVDSNGIRNVEHTTTQEDLDATRKRDILFKFKVLRRTYKEANIPAYTEYTDLKTLEREYESLVRQLSLDATVENYKKYLTILFFVFEYVVSTHFKIEDIKGFTQQQLIGMNQYERILFEIGEKSYFSGAKQWSPEVRLFGIVALNGAVFIGTKMLFRSTGNNLMGMLGQAANNTPEPTASTGGGKSTGKPRMRAPDIDLEILGAKKSM
jgi:hypothetical protein